MCETVVLLLHLVSRLQVEGDQDRCDGYLETSGGGEGMLQLDTLHTVVRAQIRAGTGIAPELAEAPALEDSREQCPALVAWKLRVVQGMAGSLAPVAGCDEWGEPPVECR